MKLIQWIAIMVGVVLMSCYIFPFVLDSFPIANSKMILAAVGVALFAIDVFRNRGNNSIDKPILQISLWALSVSFISWLSIIINNTHDYTYATYIVSMWVWLGGAYTVTRYIRVAHGSLSVALVANYLIAVCVMQCILALIFDNNEEALNWRLHTFTGEAYMGATEEDRLSGIGCALDVAGLRFSAVLIMIVSMVIRSAARNKMKLVFLYLASMLFIVVIGNMISRTTVAGAGLSILYIIVAMVAGRYNHNIARLGLIFTFLAVVSIGISLLLYNTNEKFHDNLRFGFEGFFSLVEKGEWQTRSNDILQNMVVWPDNFKTWIIGDGYIENPLDNRLDSFDPYYVGPTYSGYYMGTDIGYCRFIFYFGLVGLALFCCYFYKVTNILAGRFPYFKWMFYMILAMNFIGWCKVSSDLFMVFAPFLCISARDKQSEGYSDKALSSHY
ncbi:MAG: hypothetical protein NC453_10375 [Muribaculum sp.]|nr:hypothetical protein [Muribaculum sp.]